MQTALEKTENNSPIKLTSALLDEYRDYLRGRGYKQQTINMYFCYLDRFGDFLGSDKELTEEKINEWMNLLQRKRYSGHTIHMNLSAINGLLRYCGPENVMMPVITNPQDADCLSLTREEYLKLLSYMRRQGSYRDYLVIKTLATIDINLNELSLVTVESCQKEVVELPDNRVSEIPDSFQEELNEYIDQQNLKEGPVFVTRSGRPLDRTNITHVMEHYGGKAGIDSRKSNPRALHRLYQQIDQGLRPMHLKTYDMLLNSEQAVITSSA